MPKRCETAEARHRVDARKQMRARICLTDVKSHLSDARLDVWDEAGPDVMDIVADVTLDVGQ